MLKSVPLFATCSKRQLEDIATIADELAQPKGSTLARQGDRGHEFIILLEGMADVRRNGRRIASLGAGSFFGEIALLTDSARTADVVAATNVRTLVIGDRAFARLLREDAAVQAKLLGVLAARLAENSATTP